MDKEIKELQDQAAKAGKKESRQFKLMACIDGVLIYLASFYLFGMSKDVSYLVAWLYALYVMIAYNQIYLFRSINKGGD